MLHLYVDADACPVKQEAIKVAKRYDLSLTFVTNTWMRLPEEGKVMLRVVEGSFDAADDWIVEQAGKDDIVVTADLPLVHRCIQKGARVLNHYGRPFSADSIGEILSTRDLLTVLRGSGAVTGGPPPFQKEDRSRFLQNLDTIIQNVKHGR
jgi:uncharacterized protein YaiI (UPF0178 family)